MNTSAAEQQALKAVDRAVDCAADCAAECAADCAVDCAAADGQDSGDGDAAALPEAGWQPASSGRALACSRALMSLSVTCMLFSVVIVGLTGIA
jgi:hypothetical protein